MHLGVAYLARRPVVSLGHYGAKSFLRGAQIFQTMSSSFKLCPTHFSGQVSSPPVTGLLACPSGTGMYQNDRHQFSDYLLLPGDFGEAVEPGGRQIVGVWNLKMIRHFMPKRFGILSTPWRMSEMSETSCRKFSPRTQASYEVALEIVKQKKTHTIGETLVKPCLLKTVELLLGEASEVKMRWISLSSDALQRRFSGMPEDVKDQVINAMISSRWVNRCY